MDLKERSYSVLVVSASEKLNAALASILTEACCDPVRTVHSVSAAKRAWSERGFDLVIINSPLPDDGGIRFAIDIAGSGETAPLLIVSQETKDEILDRAVEHGVFLLAKPVTRPLVYLALEWLMAMRERLRKLEKRSLSVEEKIEEIRLVNRAKWLLISECGMDEPQAHRYVEKEAMDRCVTKRQVAEEIIRKYS